MIERLDYIVVNFGASYAFETLHLGALLSNAFDKRYSLHATRPYWILAVPGSSGFAGL